MIEETLTRANKLKAEAALGLASDYASAFSTASGSRVLADLVKKFDPARSRFTPGGTALDAAKVDGQSEVVKEILAAVRAGCRALNMSEPPIESIES